METLRRWVTALEDERNAAACAIQWQFTARQARTDLAALYPVTQATGA